MRLAGVYAKGGRIDLRMRALARVARTEPLISHAIERFLGRDLAEVQQVVEQTLEGSLREVVATMAPEMMRGDLARTSEAVIEEATHDLENLGIELDQLQVLEVDESK
jgi:flotillin